MFNEDLIPIYNGQNFIVEKETKQLNADETFTMSIFKYKEDVWHSRYNHETPSAKYIYNNKSVTSIDVVEEDQEIIDYVTWINSNINVIQHNEWTYTPDKKYDLILVDLWAMPADITDDHRQLLLDNYSSHLKEGGKIILPQAQEILE